MLNVSGTPSTLFSGQVASGLQTLFTAESGGLTMINEILITNAVGVKIHVSLLKNSDYFWLFNYGIDPDHFLQYSGQQYLNPGDLFKCNATSAVYIHISGAKKV